MTDHELAQGCLKGKREAQKALFDQYAWLVGPPGAMPQIHYNAIWTVAIAVLVILLALTPLVLARAKRDPIAEELRR